MEEDKNPDSRVEDSKPPKMSNSDKKNDSGNLHNFVLTEYERQVNEGQINPNEEIDEERMKNFFNKATSSSQKMNNEIAKSQQKMNKLYQEFNKETFEAWRNEHASEVLLPHEVEAVNLASM